jgi:hypothetical protein
VDHDRKSAASRGQVGRDRDVAAETDDDVGLDPVEDTERLGDGPS